MLKPDLLVKLISSMNSNIFGMCIMWKVTSTMRLSITRGLCVVGDKELAERSYARQTVNILLDAYNVRT